MLSFPTVAHRLVWDPYVAADPLETAGMSRGRRSLGNVRRSSLVCTIKNSLGHADVLYSIAGGGYLDSEAVNAVDQSLGIVQRTLSNVQVCGFVSLNFLQLDRWLGDNKDDSQAV